MNLDKRVSKRVDDLLTGYLFYDASVGVATFAIQSESSEYTPTDMTIAFRASFKNVVMHLHAVDVSPHIMASVFKRADNSFEVVVKYDISPDKLAYKVARYLIYLAPPLERAVYVSAPNKGMVKFSVDEGVDDEGSDEEQPA